MNKKIMIEIEELDFWRMYDLKVKRSRQLKRAITWEELILAHTLGKRLLTAQEKMEESDRDVRRIMEQNGKSRRN